ncbi:MAG: ATP-binding protein [Ignavibacteria bacterium]|jgi:two-component system phosphate regulon sensor histidine kinase PhoR|nr:ATP-binding protein [Ignavibacteria bacterium]MDH7526792.1 ATP-binding protein [Ignavibacteria bacterium]
MFKTLNSKLIFGFVVIETIIVILLLVSFNYIVVNQLKYQLIDEIKKEVNIIEFGLTDLDRANFSNHLNRLDKLSSQLKARIILYDKQKNILFDFTSGFEKPSGDYRILELAESGNYKVEIRKFRGNPQKYIYLTKKVNINLRPYGVREVGFITIVTDLSSIDHFSSDISSKIIISALLIFIAGIFLIRSFTNKIVQPITQIINSLREYSATGVPQKIEITGSEEFKFLTESINKLIEKIEADFNELKKLERYRSEFLGNVSHELRTPIFAIQSYLETLIDGGLNDPEINIKYLKKAYENLERLNRLLNDLIDISQIESKQLRFSFRYFNINDLIQRVVDNLKILAEQKEITIEFQPDDNLKEMVWGDKERLYQVFENLIENAIRHNPPKTKVKIYYQKQNSTLRIFVEDNGIGIPEEDLPRIFERFYRVDKERSRESGGTGLGLAIVKHVIEAHESKIFVESTLNQGTKFYFDLKIA